MRSVGVVPIAVVLTALTAGCGGAAAPTSRTVQVNAAQTESAWILKQEMRKLWTDHVVWTRGYIIAALGGQPDASSAADRLMRNQEDLGNAVAKYYGSAAGEQLTTLLKQHINISVDVVAAAKAGNKAALKEADDRWQQNAVQIADFLSQANPNWPRATLIDMMKTHLSTTTAEVEARLAKAWDDDVKAFDAVYAHILALSDTLSEGIVKQFPDKFETVSN